MDIKDVSKYKVDIIQPQDASYDDIIKHLLSILNDRSIPEEQKQTVRKQFDEIVRLKSITMRPPTVVLTPKE